MKKLKRILNNFTQATLGAAMAEDPAVMYASGWKYNDNGDLVNNGPTPESERLADNLAVLSQTALTTTGTNLLTNVGKKAILRTAGNVLDYMTPSHYTSKIAAKLALDPHIAAGIGEVADAVIPYTDIAANTVKTTQKIDNSIRDHDTKSAVKAGLSWLGRTALDTVTPMAVSNILQKFRSAKNLKRIADAGTLGNYGNDVVTNLEKYAVKSGDWHLHNIKSVPTIIEDFGHTRSSGKYFTNLNRININVRNNPYTSLGKEYTDALLAHEGQHAIQHFSVKPIEAVAYGKYYAPNPNNPFYKDFSILEKVNKKGTWASAPDEFTAEMAALRQLTGQHKNYNDLSPFYKKRFSSFMSNRFNLTKSQADELMRNISTFFEKQNYLRFHYKYGGILKRIK